jgi:hypothetical protein
MAGNDSDLLKKVFDNQYEIESAKEFIAEIEVDLQQRGLRTLDENSIQSTNTALASYNDSLDQEEMKEQELVTEVKATGSDWDNYLKENKVDDMLQAYKYGGMSYEESYQHTHGKELESNDDLLKRVFDNQYEIENNKELIAEIDNDLQERGLRSLDDNYAEATNNALVSYRDTLKKEEMKEQELMTEVKATGNDWNAYLKENKVDDMLQAYKYGGMSYEESYQHTHGKELESDNLNQGNNLLGTAIYEPNNKDQQKIIVRDLENDNEQEYPIKHGKTIEHNNREYPLQEILSESNLDELRTAIKENQATSFILSKTELSNIQGKNLFQSNNKNLANENRENLSNEINALKKENQHLKKQVQELEGSLKLTYVQTHMLAKDKAPQVKNRMQQVADKSGFGDTFKEKANEYDMEIQQKEQKSENQNDKDIELSL